MKCSSLCCEASAIKGDQGGAYVTGGLYGTTGDFRLKTYFDGAMCTGTVTTEFCTGTVSNLHPTGLQDAWVAKIGPTRTSSNDLVFGLVWIKAMGGSNAESTTAITHDDANGVVFITGDSKSKSMNYDGAQIMVVDPLDGMSPLTQDDTVGFVMQVDSNNGTARWQVTGPFITLTQKHLFYNRTAGGPHSTLQPCFKTKGFSPHVSMSMSGRPYTPRVYRPE